MGRAGALLRLVCDDAPGVSGELAERFLEYKRIGVTQFVLSGWPKLDEMLIFGREVLPLVRKAEQH